jgi:hypothetical protein
MWLLKVTKMRLSKGINKIVLVFGLFLILLYPTFISSGTIMNEETESIKGEMGFFRPQIKYTEVGEISFGAEDIVSEPLNFEIFGYALQVDAETLISDDDATLQLSVGKCTENSTLIKIEVELDYGDYIYSDILLDFVIYEDPDQNRIYKYTMDKPRKGFFMNLDVYPSESHLSLALDGGEKQLIYDGASDTGYTETRSILGNTATLFTMNESISLLNPIKDISFTEYLSEKKDTQLTSLSFAKTNSPSSAGPKAAITNYNYGIVHNVALEDSTWVDDIDDMMLTASSVDYKLYRNGPSESTIKSDLSYYNYYALSSYNRKIYAYTIYAHGDDDTSDWDMGGGGWLTSSEVENLWETHMTPPFYTVYPSEMIILAKSCWGMYDYDMADAFVDNGADAFVGNTLKDWAIYYMDLLAIQEGLDAFWESMANGDTVNTARSNLIEVYDDWYDDWYDYYQLFGLTLDNWSTSNILIRGSSTATI